MPCPIYGFPRTQAASPAFPAFSASPAFPAFPAFPASPTSQASGPQTLAFMKQATGILTDLKAAGPQGKITALSRLAVLNQMIDLKMTGLR